MQSTAYTVPMLKCIILCALTGVVTWTATAAPVSLFNGDDLEGWYTFLREHGKNNDPNQVFTVADGLLRISGADWGCITSEQAFSGYTLVVEYKWGTATHPPREDRARDSGVLIHSIGEDGGYNDVWMTGLEVQMIEGGTGDLLAVGDQSERFALTCPVAEKQGNSHVFDPDGDPVTIHSGRIDWWGRAPDWADVKGFRGPRDVEHPVGEWNRLEITAQGGAITVRLNGVLVNKALDCQPRHGRIQVQSEGAEVFFRRIELRPCEDDDDDAADGTPPTG